MALDFTCINTISDSYLLETAKVAWKGATVEWNKTENIENFYQITVLCQL